jgi:hypothetical protein
MAMLPFSICALHERKNHVRFENHAPQPGGNCHHRRCRRGLLGASASSANAYQGNMERAVSALYQALGSLRESTADKGGHRAKAMDLIKQAIAETQAGIEFAAERGD